MHPAAAKHQAPTAEHRWRDELQRTEPARVVPDPAFTTFELVWGSIAIVYAFMNAWKASALVTLPRLLEALS